MTAYNFNTSILQPNNSQSFSACKQSRTRPRPRRSHRTQKSGDECSYSNSMFDQTGHNQPSSESPLSHPSGDEDISLQYRCHPSLGYGDEGAPSLASAASVTDSYHNKACMMSINSPLPRNGSDTDSSSTEIDDDEVCSNILETPVLSGIALDDFLGLLNMKPLKLAQIASGREDPVDDAEDEVDDDRLTIRVPVPDELQTGHVNGNASGNSSETSMEITPIPIGNLEASYANLLSDDQKSFSDAETLDDQNEPKIPLRPKRGSFANPHPKRDLNNVDQADTAFVKIKHSRKKSREWITNTEFDKQVSSSPEKFKNIAPQTGVLAMENMKQRTRLSIGDKDLPSDIRKELAEDRKRTHIEQKSKTEIRSRSNLNSGNDETMSTKEYSDFYKQVFRSNEQNPALRHQCSGDTKNVLRRFSLVSINSTRETPAQPVYSPNGPSSLNSSYISNLNTPTSILMASSPSLPGNDETMSYDDLYESIW